MRLVGAMNHIGTLRHRLGLLRRQSEEKERELHADLVSQESRFLAEMAAQRAEAQRQACGIAAEKKKAQDAMRSAVAAAATSSRQLEQRVADAEVEVDTARSRLEQMKVWLAFNHFFLSFFLYPLYLFILPEGPSVPFSSHTNRRLLMPKHRICDVHTPKNFH